MVKDNNREGIGLMIWESGEYYFGKFYFSPTLCKFYIMIILKGNGKMIIFKE